MILTIDKTKELTRKEYIDFLQKTKGETLSESRISQLVSAGKLNVRNYPELNNLQLIVLGDDEQALAQARFTTSQALHSYSYKELGLMVGKLIHDLTNESGNAKTLLAEKQAQLEQLVKALSQTEKERNNARGEAETLKEQIRKFTQTMESQQVTLREREGELVRLQDELKGLNQHLKETQQKLTAESSFRGEFEQFKGMVLSVLQKPQTAEAISSKKSPARKATSKRTPGK